MDSTTPHRCTVCNGALEADDIKLARACSTIIHTTVERRRGDLAHLSDELPLEILDGRRAPSAHELGWLNADLCPPELAELADDIAEAMWQELVYEKKFQVETDRRNGTASGMQNDPIYIVE